MCEEREITWGEKRSDNTYSKNVEAFFAHIVGGWKKSCERQHFHELREDVNTAGLNTFPESTVLRPENRSLPLYMSLQKLG